MASKKVNKLWDLIRHAAIETDDFCIPLGALTQEVGKRGIYTSVSHFKIAMKALQTQERIKIMGDKVEVIGNIREGLE